MAQFIPMINTNPPGVSTPTGFYFRKRKAKYMEETKYMEEEEIIRELLRRFPPTDQRFAQEIFARRKNQPGFVKFIEEERISEEKWCFTFLVRHYGGVRLRSFVADNEWLFKALIFPDRYKIDIKLT